MWVIIVTYLTSNFGNLFHIFDIQFFQFFAQLDLKSHDSSLLRQHLFWFFASKSFDFKIFEAPKFKKGIIFGKKG